MKRIKIMSHTSKLNNKTYNMLIIYPNEYRTFCDSHL